MTCTVHVSQCTVYVSTDRHVSVYNDHQLSSSIICLFPSGCEEATKELERYKVSEDTEMW